MAAVLRSLVSLPATATATPTPASAAGPTVAGPLQVTATTVVAVAGTFLLFAGFLVLTTHVAARNVLGDVPAENALLVGPVPAAVCMVGVGIGAFPLLVALAAIVADLVAIERVYDLDRRTAAYVTLVHAVVTVILMAIGGALLALVAQGPPEVEAPSGWLSPPLPA